MRTDYVSCGKDASQATDPPSRFRRMLTSLIVVAAVGMSAAGAAVVPPPSATLSPSDPDASSLSTRTGADLPLQVVKRVDGRGIVGQRVEWTATGPGKVELAPAHSLTLAKSTTAEAGTAGTVFHASVPGDYVVTASTQKNPGCTGARCARWVSTRFAVNVAQADAAAAGGASDAGHDGHLAAAAALVGGALAVVAASSHGSDRNVAPLARDLIAVSGDGQSAGANLRLADPLTVRATGGGTSVPGVQVNWSASGGAVLSGSTSTTDGNGLASIRVSSVGPGPGQVTITASRADLPSATVKFTATILQPGLTIVSGDGQSGIPNSLSKPLVVEALLGSGPQQDVPIRWAVTGGDATIASVSNNQRTNVNGRSSAIVDFGTTQGPVQVTATRTDVGLSQTFSLNLAISHSLTIVGGNAQAACPLQALPQGLAVRTLTNNAPAAGVTVNWLASGSTVLSNASTVSGVNGIARVRVTNIGRVYVGTPTSVTITASRADDATATATFVEPIAASTMSIVGGNNQQGTVGGVSGWMTVELRDGCGNPIANEPVSWSISPGAATLSATLTNTNAAGQAQVRVNYGNQPQTVTVQASALGGTVNSAFNASASASGGNIVGGNNQTGQPGVTLPTPLSVNVQPPIAGIPVSFVVTSGSATVIGSPTVTDASGNASAQLQLGFTPGPVTVNAIVGGTTIASFSATVSSGTPSGLSIVSGNNQQIAPSVASQPLVVQLTANNSPLQGMSIDWSTSSGTLSANSSTTDSKGQASITLTPSGTGPITVTATFPGQTPYPSAQITFTENTALAAEVAVSTNDASVAHALDDACTALQNMPDRTSQQQDMLNQCLALTEAGTDNQNAVAEAIHQMIPAVAEAQTATATSATTTQFNNLAGRMQALRGGAHGVSFAGLAFGNDTGSLSLGDLGSALLGAADDKKEAGSGFSRWGFFGSGQIQRQNASAQAATPGYSFGSNGVTFGVDYRVNDGLVVGGALGYTHQSTTLDAGQGDMSMNGWSFSGYATWYNKSDWYIDSSLTWSSNNFDARRAIVYVLPLPGGASAIVNQIASSSSGGNDFAGSVSFGRDFHDKALAYGFYGKLQYDHSSFDGFQERLNAGAPGSGLGLRVDARSTTSIASVLGAKIDYNISKNWGVLVPHAEVEWQHEFRTNPNTFTAYFLNDPTNTPILIRGDDADSNFFRIGAGLSFVFTQGRSAFLLYDRTVGQRGITAYNLSFGFRLEF